MDGWINGIKRKNQILHISIYPLDIGVDVTQDRCLTAANFRSTAAYFDQKPSTKTSN